MKILAIIGSPRRGNTYKAVQAVEKSMKELGEIEFEYLFLKDSNLKSCLGCSRCILIGEDKCPLKDERENIERKIADSDGIIFASPNYLCNVSALMKNFMDRFAYCGHRPRFFQKKAMVICTSAGPGGLKQCMNSLSYIASAGFHIVQKVGIMTPLYPLAQGFQDQADTQLLKGAKKFYEALCKNSIKKPSLTDIMKFRAVRSFLLCKVDYLPSDYAYWNLKHTHSTRLETTFLQILWQSIKASGYFACIRKEPPGNIQVVMLKLVRLPWKLPKESCMKRQEPLTLKWNHFVTII